MKIKMVFLNIGYMNKIFCERTFQSSGPPTSGGLPELSIESTTTTPSLSNLPEEP
jgi:hypothetical protein